MPYIPKKFITTAVINADTLFQNYDDEVQVLMSDVGNYLSDEIVKVYTETEIIVTDGIKVNSVETIEDLATQDGVVFKTIIVKDLNRGGTFIWSATGTANGGTIFDSSSTGKWHRQYDGAVNVKWFGAKGDGITDDTTSLQNAINTNLKIELEENKVYIISSGLTATSLLMDGKNSTIKLSASTFGGLLVSGSNSHIINLIIDGNNGAGTFSNNGLNYGLKFSSYTESNNIVEKCKLLNLKFIGVEIKSSKTIVSKCSFSNCGYGAVFSYNIFNHIIDNTFVSCGNSTTSYDGAVISVSYNAIDGYTMATTLGERNTIKNNYISTSLQVGIDTHSGHNLIIDGNTINNCSLEGIYIHRSSPISAGLLDTDGIARDNLITNNNIYLCLIGITLNAYEPSDTTNRTGCTDNNVISNSIKDCTSYGIFLSRGCKSNTISQNKVYGAGRCIGIFYWNNNNIISNNSLKATATTGYCIDFNNSTTNYSDSNFIENNIIDLASFNINAIRNTTGGRYTRIKNNDFINRGTKYPILDSAAGSAAQAIITHISRSFTYADSLVSDMKGEVILNLAPTAGGTIGWVCTTAGDQATTAGTWKTFGAITA